MGIYHVNEAGEPGRCKARLKNCPFGGAEDHYLSKDAARKAYELKQANLIDAEYAAKSLDITTEELRLIDAKLLKQAIRLSQAANGRERELIEVETRPIAIIRAVRIEEHTFALNGATDSISHAMATEDAIL